MSPYQYSSFAATRQAFLLDPGLPFADALPEEQLQQLIDAEGVHFGQGDDDVYCPAVTLWAWLSQCLSSAKSCVAAVARILVLRVALGLPPCSAATGGYCKARAKLPERFLQRLTYQVGNAVEDAAPDAWRWHGRRVLLADGFTVTLPDTEANQQDYPQPRSQKPGLGWPMIRAVVLLTFATASLVGCAFGSHQGKETGETALFRQLLEQVRAGDVAVADRYYCSYWQVAALQGRGAAAVFRMHQRRHYDFRRGQRLGTRDHIVVWHKPARPDWMAEADYAQVPAELTIRELHFTVSQPGYRPRAIVVATTLTDATVYSKAEVADLYHYRWQVELDIRAIKQTLKMEHLSCQTPEQVRKELWTHLVAYNLVRRVMAQAALAGQCQPRQLSLAGAVQTLNAFRWLLLLGEDGRRREWAGVLWLAVRTHVVGDRPGRCEPRKVKRRPKQYGRLMRPRSEERTRLRRGRSA